MRIARLTVENAPRPKGIRSNAFDGTCERENWRAGSRVCREGGVDPNSFPFNPLEILWKRIDLALVLNVKLLRAVVLGVNLKSNVAVPLRSDHLQLLFAWRRRKRNAYYRDPAVALQQCRDAMSGVLNAGFIWVGIELHDCDATRNTTLSRQTGGCRLHNRVGHDETGEQQPHCESRSLDSTRAVNLPRANFAM